jgi:hypothetical protein
VVYIRIGNTEILLAAVYKSPGRTWSDADIAELLKLSPNGILAGDLNAKHPSWNSAVSNPSGEKLLQLFDVSEFEISAPVSNPLLPPGKWRCTGYCGA